MLRRSGGKSNKRQSQPHAQALARKLATESIVLLKNSKKNSNPVLPIKKKAHVAVIGPNANRTMTLLSNYPGCKTQPGGAIDPVCDTVWHSTVLGSRWCMYAYVRRHCTLLLFRCVAQSTWCGYTAYMY